MKKVRSIVGKTLILFLFVSISFFSSKLLGFTVPAQPGDSTPPTVSLISPVSDEATSTLMTLAATATDNVAISAVYFYIDDVLRGSGDVTSPYYISYDTTSISDGTHTAFAVAQDSSSNFATSSSVSFNIDKIAVIISNTAVAASSSSATITWTTDEAASSLVNFGLTSNYNTSTAETDTTIRVQNHSIILENLVSCSRYHYQVRSADAAGNITTSSDDVFDTTGCVGNASFSAVKKEDVVVAAGSTVTQGTITLEVPSAVTEASSDLTFQVIELGSDFFESAGNPTGKTSVGSSVFNLKAFTDATNTVSSFSKSIAVTMTYQDSDVMGIEESSLQIYRYDNSVWVALSNCSVDINTNTVTCETEQFSDFAIFGNVISADASANISSSGSIARRISNLENMGNYDLAHQLAEQTKTEKSESVQDKAVSTNKIDIALIEGRDLDLDNWGDDVILLQEFLIQNSVGTSTSELRRVGITGYFGPFTQGALGEFQKTAGIYPNIGYFGPITKKYLKNLEISGQ